MLAVAFHLDSTKFVGLEVKPEEVEAFAADAVRAFRRDLNDPDIHESRVAVVRIDAAPGARVLGATTVAAMAPQPAPSVVTHGA